MKDSRVTSLPLHSRPAGREGGRREKEKGKGTRVMDDGDARVQPIPRLVEPPLRKSEPREMQRVQVLSLAAVTQEEGRLSL